MYHNTTQKRKRGVTTSIKEKIRLLLERPQCYLGWSRRPPLEGDPRLLKGREGERKEALKEEEIYGGPEGAKELGVTEELDGQGGRNTRVRGRGRRGIGVWLR